MPTLATLNDGASPLLNSKLNEALANKNANGVSVITVGEHSSDITALVYVRGTMSNPEVVKVVRVNENVKDSVNISAVITELLDYETNGFRNSIELAEVYARQRLFTINTVQDFDTYSQLRKHRVRQDSLNHTSKQNGARGDEQNSRVNQAELENSAFSNGDEGENRFSLDTDNIPNIPLEDILDEDEYTDKERLDAYRELSLKQQKQIAELKRQMKLTIYDIKDENSVASYVKRLLKGTRLDVDAYIKRLNSDYLDISRHDGEVTDAIYTDIQEIAKDIVDTQTEKIQGEHWQDLKDFFKSGPMTLAEQDRADINDYKAFSKKYRRLLNLRNEGGRGVDSIYMELCEMFPGLFDEVAPQSIHSFTTLDRSKFV